MMPIFDFKKVWFCIWNQDLKTLITQGHIASKWQYLDLNQVVWFRDREVTDSRQMLEAKSTGLAERLDDGEKQGMTRRWFWGLPFQLWEGWQFYLLKRGDVREKPAGRLVSA